MSGPVGSSTWFGKPGYNVDQTLRFDGTDNYLYRVLTTAGNRRTHTISAWIKRSKITTQQYFWTASDASGNMDLTSYFSAADTLVVGDGIQGGGLLQTTQKFRDVGAWYHIVWVLDSTQSTVNNRLKIYVNGAQVTDFVVNKIADGIDQNQEMGWNIATNEHRIGRRTFNNSSYLAGYLAEFNFVDGIALSPSDFGTTGDYEAWIPKLYAGAYGTTGFYLPFNNDYAVEGFSTVTYKGNATAGRYIGGTGFKPGWIWNATRSASQNRFLYDVLRGVDKDLRSNQDSDEGSSDGVKSFEDDGFTVGSGNDSNENGKTYVNWCWDMGSSNANNTAGNIDSVVRANTTYGQSVVTFTGDGQAGQAVGHGLGVAPKFIILKNRDDDSTDWFVSHATVRAVGANKYLLLNTTAAQAENSDGAWAGTLPNANTFTVHAAGRTNTDGKKFVAYCFAEVSGYSKFDSYTGNATAGNTITTGFPVGWVMIKSSTAVNDWNIFDNTRTPTGISAKRAIRANDASVEQTGAELEVELTATGFKINTTATELNTNNATYVYMAFADTRDFAYNLDQSGNNNDWMSDDITESDISVDSPTNNFATMSATNNNTVLSEGGLKSTFTSNAFKSAFGTHLMQSGKWYAEMVVVAHASGNTAPAFGVATEVAIGTFGDPENAGFYIIASNGGVYKNGSETTGYTAANVGDILQIAVDIDAGKIWYGLNNTYIDSGNPATGANPVTNANLQTPTVFNMLMYGTANIGVANFGQDSSFAGSKIAQGHQDGNGIGDFFYAPPAGFLALCTENLSEPTIDPSNHFNTVIWTGNGSDDRAITGVGFQPDFSWIKSRNTTNDHLLFDVLRGVGKYMRSNAVDTETNNADTLQAFASDGFEIGTDSRLNGNNDPVISWNWKAGNANTAFAESGNNPAGTHRANQAAGFSIVSYTGTGATGTVAHGLGAAPEWILIKNRDVNDEWYVYYGDNTDYLVLNDTDAPADSAAAFNDTSPTSTVFTVNTSHSVNADGEKYIAYCFRSIDGHSKLGQYEGNNNANGTFVYTGFRPSLVVVKDIDATGEWRLQSTAMTTFNFDDVSGLTWNNPQVEYTTDRDDLDLDFLSNGFKHRSTYSQVNAARTYIYFAFAETPFKYSNAR